MTRQKTQTRNEEVEVRLASLPGVREVDTSALPSAIALSVSAEGQVELIREAVRTLLADDPDSTHDLEVEITMDGPALPRNQRRSRFDSITVDYPGRDRITARVELGWDGEQWEGFAEGVMNAASELRVCASATLRAVEKIVEDRATFSVIGVKEIPVFDHNLVVVLVQSPEVADRLLGLAIITEDRRRAAAMAALNATNRIMGRFIED